ncbi:MAG: PAS domain-containing protein, partial [Spirochaetes bacterium]|nr:PAS domain-containing protein [Spirochaetota bacterium]
MLTPIVIVTLASSLLLFFVNYLLYREYRQQALQFWMYSWGFYTIRFLFDLASILVPWFGWDLFLQLSVIASGLFLFQGTYRYLHPKKKIPVGWVLFAAFVGILVLIHPIVSLPPLVTTSFSFLFLGLSNLVMGWYFFQDRSIPQIERLLLGGILVLWGIHKLDYPFLRPFPSFAVWGYTLGSVLGIATGVTLLLVFLSSEKRRAETAESHFFSLVNSLDDVFGILDREGRFTGVFGQWLKRQSVEPSWYIGKTAIDVFGKEIGSTLHEMAMRVFRENTGITFDWEMPLSEGKRYFQTILSPVRDETGACTEIVTVGRDVTSLRQSLEEVQNRLEEKNVLVREIQHRVQNNLQVIISLLNLQMQSESSKEARQALQVAISRIHTFSDLYSQLQDKEDVAHIRMDQFLHSLVSRLLDTGKILD